MAHVTLIRPPFVAPTSSHLASLGTPPLGLAYLAGAVKARGHRTTCIDAFGEKIHVFRSFGEPGLLINGESAEEIIARIPAETDAVGISSMFSNEWIYTREVIHRIAAAFPYTPILAGGEHVTADFEQVLEDCPELAACVLGEGEETLAEVLETLARGGDLSLVAGLALRDGSGRAVRTPPRSRIGDVDSIPWPSWEEIPIRNYLDRGLGFGRQGKRCLPVLASRGCPYRCTFCSSPQMWTTRWRARDVEDLLDEIEHHVRRYGIEHFDFYDLTAIIDKKWILRFCRRLLERGIRLTWALPSGTRSEALTADVLALMRQSGCCKVNYAPESGSRATLERIKKQVKLEKMLPSMRSAVRAGIVTRANLLIGLPGQTWKEILDDFVFAAKLAWIGLNDIAVFAFAPYPGSELFARLVREGRIERGEGFDRFLAFNVTNSLSKMKSWSEHVEDWQMRPTILSLMAFFYILQFLFRPHRLAALVYRVVFRRPLTSLEIILTGILQDLASGRKRSPKTKAPGLAAAQPSRVR